MTCNFVHTLGDSTLDTLFWELLPYSAEDWPANATPEEIKATAKENSVEGRLQTILGPGYEEVSHAYDGFDTHGVLEGDIVGRVLPSTLGLPLYLEMKADGEEQKMVYPLKEFKASVNKHPKATHYVVISVGGNDFRNPILAILTILKGVWNVRKRYLKIVDEVYLKDRDIRPILMFQYCPEADFPTYSLLNIVAKIAVAINILSITTISISLIANYMGKIRLRTDVISILFSGTILAISTMIVPLKVVKSVLSRKDVGIQLLGSLMEWFYKPILEDAKKRNIPILDITNTFDPFHDQKISENEDRMYVCQIEPGPKGSELIAEGIDHIVKNHDYTQPSLIYSKKPDEAEYASIENEPAKWRVS